MSLMKLAILPTAFLIASPLASASTSAHPPIDRETLEYLVGKAARHSGLPALTLNELPPIQFVSEADLNKTVCPDDPENCRQLAAVFDDLGYRILVRDDFDISENFNPYDYSFLIHEIVHALQYRSRGAEIFNGCDAVKATEIQAYDAQDSFLKEAGDFHRLGQFIRFSFYCEEETAQKDYLKSKERWDARNASGKFKLETLPGQ
ncbi:MAG: hypothetical protein JNJ49_14310 [Bdellovibrionaceae bacterium]|nr:hypothetical protein [Pseudobdellovibrionaceae bacterium]